MTDSKILYTYGTLRPGIKEPVKVPGTLYAVSWFPGAILDETSQSTFLAEPVVIQDWEGVDAYEGYDPNNPEQSLYIRKPYLDGYIYEYNRDVAELEPVESGDWLEHLKEEKGRYAGRF